MDKTMDNKLIQLPNDEKRIKKLDTSKIYIPMSSPSLIFLV